MKRAAVLRDGINELYRLDEPKELETREWDKVDVRFNVNENQMKALPKIQMRTFSRSLFKIGGWKILVIWWNVYRELFFSIHKIQRTPHKQVEISIRYKHPLVWSLASWENSDSHKMALALNYLSIWQSDLYSAEILMCFILFTIELIQTCWYQLGISEILSRATHQFEHFHLVVQNGMKNIQYKRIHLRLIIFLLRF